MKLCGKCDTRKELSEFGKKRATPDGLQHRCKRCRSTSEKAWRQAHPANQLESLHRSREDNPARTRAVYKRYYEANKAKYTAAAAKRRAYTLLATPLWYNAAETELLYRVARKMTERTGIEYHVDHIVPLQGKNVCGLHVHNNLQILTASDNLSKSNRHDI